MKKIMHNGKFYIEEGRFEQAVLIEDGIIKKIGPDDEILMEEGERYDCMGRTVIPGFNDSHIHFLLVGSSLSKVNINGCRSIDELVNRCREYTENNPYVNKKGLSGMGWNQDQFTEGEKRMPDRHDLDRISTEIPIVLERVCAHVLVTNTKAIELLGLDENSPQYEGGVFEIGEDGKPNGIFCEKACAYAQKLIAEDTPQEMRAHMNAAMEYAVSRGITSVQSCDLGVSTQKYEEFMEMMEEFYKSGQGILRYRHQVYYSEADTFRRDAEDGLFRRKTGNAEVDSMLKTGPVKIFKDGSLGGRTAMLRKPYSDAPGVYGVEAVSDEKMDDFCRIASENSIQIIIHAIGDAAIEKVLDSYEKTMSEEGNINRNGIVHCQITDSELIERIAQSGVLLMIQPVFLNSDMHILEQRVGKELASTSYAYNTMMSMKSMKNRISFGTDSPVEDCNPFDNIYSAVARKDLGAGPQSGFYPLERITVSQAVDAYTLGSAYNEFMEERKGRIRENHYADLVVLDRDIFTAREEEIRDVKPLMTMVNGNTVYEA